MPKFGDANEGDINVTILSREFVSIDHPDDQLEDDTSDPALGNTLANFILKQQERALEREHDLEGLLNSSEPLDEASVMTRLALNSDEKDEKQGSTGRYVPPSGRTAAGGASLSVDRNISRTGGGLDSAFKSASDRDHENTIRVSNLTKAVTEDDLRDLFGVFGRIHRISLPRVERNENNKIVKEPRGFAYIAFANHEDAAEAMERLQGHGYDHLILKLEWAKPPSKDEGSSGGLSMGNVSGYGTKLAQDTKEAVTYASNLTGNR